MKAHLTAEAVAAAAAAGTGGGGPIFVSTNDAVVVFVWMLMRELKRESLGRGGRGLLSFTVQLNVRAFGGVEGALRGCLGSV
jgi:hypothetical protein